MPESATGVPNGQSEYNFIYRELVKDEADVIGVIAYSVYKRQKIEYIESIRAEHARSPDRQVIEQVFDVTISNNPASTDVSEIVDAG